MKFKPQIYLDDICFEINSKPREIFDFKCAFKFWLSGVVEITKKETTNN